MGDLPFDGGWVRSEHETLGRGRRVDWSVGRDGQRLELTLFEDGGGFVAALDGDRVGCFRLASGDGAALVRALSADLPGASDPAPEPSLSAGAYAVGRILEAARAVQGLAAADGAASPEVRAALAALVGALGPVASARFRAADESTPR